MFLLKSAVLTYTKEVFLKLGPTRLAVLKLQGKFTP